MWLETQGWFLTLVFTWSLKSPLCQAYPTKVGSGHRRAKATSFQTSSSKETCLRVLVVETTCRVELILKSYRSRISMNVLGDWLILLCLFVIHSFVSSFSLHLTWVIYRDETVPEDEPTDHRCFRQLCHPEVF